MKLLVMSDIHLEFSELKLENLPEHDVVVLVGDIGTGVMGVEWALNTFYKPVLYVNGNHEHWTTEFTYEQLYAKQHVLTRNTNVRILENDSVQIGDVLFIGATLWTDFNLYLDMTYQLARATKFMEEEYTYLLRSNITPPIIAVKHRKSLKFIEDQLDLKRPKKKVVITHHAPSEESVSPEFAGSRGNPFFASDLNKFVNHFQPHLWLHGHMHSSSDYRIGRTRVICNPRGLVSEVNEGNLLFDPNLVIEI